MAKADNLNNTWVIEGQSKVEELNLGKNQSGKITVSGEKLTLQTAGKWVDRNIEVGAPVFEVNAKMDAASIKSGDALIDTVAVGEKSGATYAVSGSGVVAAPSAVSAGFISETVGEKAEGAATLTSTIAAGSLGSVTEQVAAGSATMSANGFTASTEETSYAIDLTTVAGQAQATASVANEGYVRNEQATSAAINIAVSGNGDKLYIPEADVEVAVVETANPAVTVTTDASAIKTVADENAYKIEIKTAKTAGSAKADASTTGLGMVAADDAATKNIALDVTITDADAVYIKPAAVSAAGKDADLSDFEAMSVTAPSQGYLTIAEGYIENTKISLADLIPDTATIEAKDAPYIKSGVSAFDKDGNLIVGTMADVTPSRTDDVISWTEGFVEAGSITVAEDTVKLGADVKEGDFEVAPSFNDQTITVTKGWEPGRTITVKGSATGAKAELGAEATVSATVSTLNVGDSDLAAGTVAISATQAIAGKVNGSTVTSGYAEVGVTKVETETVSGNAVVDATLPLFVGDYILG